METGSTTRRVSLRCVLGIAIFAALLPAVRSFGQNPPLTVRVGYLPNITHAQALEGRATGAFERALGPAVKIDWKIFNAGPSVMEAMFARSLDLAYIGPSPTITGYIRSEGTALRVIAGATSGGAALVVRPGANIQKAADFHGRKVASPQLGNTQDVALRTWLAAQGLKTAEKGGDIQIIPIANPDQLTLFAKGEIDAAWAPEPWASRLMDEAGARLFLDERDLWPNRAFVSAHLIVSTSFLAQHPDLVKAWLRAHVELTDRINRFPAEAHRIINQQIQKDTGKALALKVIDDAFSRLQITYDPIRTSLLASARSAYDLGLLGRERPNLSGLYELKLLNEILAEKKTKLVE